MVNRSGRGGTGSKGGQPRRDEGAGFGVGAGPDTQEGFLNFFDLLAQKCLHLS
jgi:hypothetical protein